MRIGLLRHFLVDHPFVSGWRTAGELHAWRQRYDTAPVVLPAAPPEIGAWDECFSSDLERALTTARTVFAGPVRSTPLLREVEFAEFQTGGTRLPVRAWRWLLRLAWLSGHASQRRLRDEFRRQMHGAVDLLVARPGSVLAVSHAGMMAFLSAELRRRGYRGPRLMRPQHATLYVYEKTV